MISRREALKYAIQERRCPPLSIKKAPDQRDRFLEHCRICPFCRPEMDTDLDNWDRMGESLSTTIHREKEDRDVLPGQIRRLKIKKSPWRKGFYLNPPDVLVLKETADGQGFLPVAQTFSDPVLAGPGDLILDEIFVESWNLFNIRKDGLGEIVQDHGPDIAGDIRSMHMNPEFSPAWAPVPVPLGKDDPRGLFRKLERETAAFFNDNILSPPLFHFLNWKGVISELSKLDSRIKWSSESPNLWELISSMELPDSYYPKAAADEELVYYYAKLVLYEKGRFKGVRSVWAEAEGFEHKTGIGYTIFFPELPVPREGLWAYAYLKTPDGKIIPPVKILTSMKDVSISVKFHVDSWKDCELMTSLFYQLLD